MASLSLLLNDPISSSPAPAPVPTAGPSTSNSHRAKSKRPSRAVAAWLADDDDGSARRSSRQSTKPKRYAEELYNDNGEQIQGDYDSAFTMPGRLSNGQFMPSTKTEGNIDLEGTSDAESDEEGNGLLRATTHIWHEPLQNYILALHAKKQKIENDFEKAEQSRQFVAAARVTEMSAKRVVEMKERREARLVELKFEEEERQRALEEERVRLEKEEAKKLAKDKDKEERLRKQREAAKRKRDEDRAKKERDDESRKARSEKERLARIAEAERKAALTPEEREAEEKAAALQKELAVAKALQDSEAAIEGGRGGRKKRKVNEDDPSKVGPSGLGRHGDGSVGPDGEFDELEDDDALNSSISHQGTPVVEVPPASGSSRPRKKGSSSSARHSSAHHFEPYPQFWAPPPPGAVDAHGRPFHPYAYGPAPPLPPGAYVAPDGVMYDAHGTAIAYPGPPPGYMVPGGSGGYPVAGPSGSPPAGHYPYGPDSHHPHPHAHAHHHHPPSSSTHGGDDQVEPGFGYGDAGEDVEELLSMTGKGSRNPKVLATKRWKAIEDLEKRVWTQIAKRDIPKVIRVTQQSTSSRQFFAKRLSTIVAREARRAAQRTRGAKDIQTRAKKVMREMMVFMKGNEKRDRETRKKAEKEALDKAKKEEDMREAQRAARKLNFLITQTELYSHFVGNKIKTNEAEDSADTAGAAPAAPAPQSASLLAAIAAGDAPAGAELKELDFDVDDETNAAYHARRNAQAAVDAAKAAAAEFDAAAGGAGPVASTSAAPAEAPEEMDFQNPTAMNGDVQVKQPKILTCTLKEYQLKGLNWLANLYEQGINGILADEMGLGKTVQSISLMAYLAEVHNIWGPFLVIAPASTLHNWQQEITRFVPSLKALPYWGNTKDRATLRKFWNRKSLRYDKDAPFHILVTSYQLVVQDEKYFQGVKWQYMVLDEAQAIKSSTSTRWKTLLGFRCRNRLLLTGTPIQNSMHELWALLHFIMPSLFDSHDEFSDWFSKDIEGNAEKQGAMNEHQLRRLHMILKPFMLRRIKKNVQNELGDKIEIDLYCDLTPRQKSMYRTLRENISITDLVSRATSINDDDSVKRLMNLIMQFRKVCNHPELFERADVTAPLAFSSYNDTANLIRDPEVLEVPYAVSSTIEYRIPKLLYRDGGMLATVNEGSRAGFNARYLDRLMNIWTPEYIQQSLASENSAFSFARGLKLSPAELSKSVKSHGLVRLGLGLERQAAAVDRHEHASLLDDEVSTSLRLDLLPKSSTLPFDHKWRDLGLTPLGEIEQNYRLTSRLSHPDARFFMDPVVAPAIEAVCSDRSFAYDQTNERFDPLFSAAIFGVPSSSQNSTTEINRFERALPGLPAKGVLSASSMSQLPFPPMQVPQLQKLILDSGKLAKLDTLLAELKANGHRVLLYFQMTRMIDLMEEYLAFRQFKYLRLDGSSTISERRDMVTDWQTKPELFIFLLSTRAGGLGINLTAADTVIFYDSDWNPSNDLQAMDRAHRLGQTKQVTVYRLITKDTVDERIVQLARNKKLVQDAVVGSSSATHADGAAAQKNEVMSLLLGEEELEESLRQAELKRKRAEEKAIADGKRGAKTREENKKIKLAEAAEKEADKKRKLGGGGWDAADDEDAFSFFTNPTTNSAADDDEGGAGTGADTPKLPAPKKRGGVGGKKRKLDDGEAGAAPKAPKRSKKKKDEVPPSSIPVHTA